MVNYNLFSKATRGIKLERAADMLGMDQDDFKDSSLYDKVTQVNNAKEYMRSSMEKKSNNYTISETPKLEETIYRKAGVDEYRRSHWKKYGISKDMPNYKLGAIISAEKLFNGDKFMVDTMPAIFEDAFGNVWERLVKEKGK